MGSFDRFIDQSTVLLTTYRRDGTPVGTPVHIAVAGDHAYIRTFDAAGKAKRLRRNPRIRIAPSTFRGRPTGPAIAGTARLLEGAEAEEAARALRHKYPILHGWLIPRLHRLRGQRTLHFRVDPVPAGNTALYDGSAPPVRRRPADTEVVASP